MFLIYEARDIAVAARRARCDMKHGIQRARLNDPPKDYLFVTALDF